MNNPLNKYEHMLGKKYENLTVVGPEEIVMDQDMNEIKRNIYCHCDCGRKYVLLPADLIENGSIISCGVCVPNNVSAKDLPSTGHVTHGDSKRGPYHSLYINWKTVRRKCKYNENHLLFGIKFYEEWENWDNFKQWAIENEWIYGEKLRRYDETKDYSPYNCYFD